MNSEIIAEWVIVSIIFASMLAYSFFLGDYIVRAGFRWLGRSRVSVYRKWGVEQDLFYPSPLWGFIALGIVIVVFAALTFLFSMVIVAIFMQKPVFTEEVLERTFSIAMIPFVLGFFTEQARIWNILEKIDKLNKLPPHFHQKFSVTELLSMHEALRSAPSIFWEEYSNLEKWQINNDTNRRYRENAAPFRHNRLHTNNKVMLGITIALFVLTVIAVAIGAADLLSLLDSGGR